MGPRRSEQGLELKGLFYNYTFIINQIPFWLRTSTRSRGQNYLLNDLTKDPMNPMNRPWKSDLGKMTLENKKFHNAESFLHICST